MLRALSVTFLSSINRLSSIRTVPVLGRFVAFDSRSKASRRTTVATQVLERERSPVDYEESQEQTSAQTTELAVSQEELTALQAAVDAPSQMTALSPKEEVQDMVKQGIPVGNIPASVEQRLLDAMRKEHELLVEEMKSWDNDPIWQTYEAEANKLMWEINQKWNKLGVHLRDPRIREQCHVEMASALEDLQKRYAKEVAQQLSDSDVIRLMRLPPGTKLNEVNFNAVMQKLFNVSSSSGDTDTSGGMFGLDELAAKQAVDDAVQAGQLEFAGDKDENASPRNSTQSDKSSSTAQDDSNSLLAAAKSTFRPKSLSSSSSAALTNKPKQLSGSEGVSDDEVYDEDRDLILKHVDDSFSRQVLAQSRRREATDAQRDLQLLFDQQRKEMQQQRSSATPANEDFPPSNRLKKPL